MLPDSQFVGDMPCTHKVTKHPDLSYEGVIPRAPIALLTTHYLSVQSSLPCRFKFHTVYLTYSEKATLSLENYHVNDQALKI